MKKVLAIVLSVLMLIGLCACAGNALKGTEWKLTGMTVEGLTVGEADLAGLGLEGSLSFTDKEVTLVLSGEEDATASYSVKDGVVTITDETGETMVATLDGDQLVMDFEGVGSMIFTKQ